MAELAVVGYGEEVDEKTLHNYPGVMVMQHGQAIAVAASDEFSTEGL